MEKINDFNELEVDNNVYSSIFKIFKCVLKTDEQDAELVFLIIKIQCFEDISIQFCYMQLLRTQSF
jgi:hypothetical protein